MSEPFKKILRFTIYIAIAIFVVCILISQPQTFRDYTGYMGLAVSMSIIISMFYEKWGWKIDPTIKIPRLYKRYKGVIEYNYKGQPGKKNIEVYVSQSLFSLNIQLVTNEIASSTITSNIVQENGNYVLYYTYITNPKSKFSDENPIQYGTSRFVIDNPKRLNGTYWTTRRTIGDIYLEYSVDRKIKNAEKYESVHYQNCKKEGYKETI